MLESHDRQQFAPDTLTHAWSSILRIHESIGDQRQKFSAEISEVAEDIAYLVKDIEKKRKMVNGITHIMCYVAIVNRHCFNHLSAYVHKSDQRSQCTPRTGAGRCRSSFDQGIVPPYIYWHFCSPKLVQSKVLIADGGSQAKQRYDVSSEEWEMKLMQQKNDAMGLTLKGMFKQNRNQMQV